MIDRALRTAARAHRNQLRKGTDIPYIVHPSAVGIMLARAGCPEEVIVAGILHDTVEDTDLTIEDIREQFGPGVAAIVEGCSEPDKSARWEERKQHTIDYLRDAPPEVRVVACADKLHNIRSMASEFERVGEKVWGRFRRGREEQAWYYRSVVDSLCTPRPGEKENPFCDDLRREVEKLFGPASSPPPG